MAVVKSLPATKSLSNQLKYLAKEGKTVEELKEGINCTTDNVEQEFNIIKELHNKTDGKQYYHFTQAFSPEDNITPQKAHEIGKEWINNNIKDHQVYMVTHIDKNHIHNHFVINSVNIDNGLKLQISPSKLFEMKKDSNRLCERENLSKINLERNKGVSKTDGEYRLEKKGITPWKDELRQCIDFGRSQTKSIGELKEFLKEHFNIEVRETKKSISYKHPEQNTSVRGNRLGGNYTKEGLLNEFNAREIKPNERGSIRTGDNISGNERERSHEEQGGTTNPSGINNSANKVARKDIGAKILFGGGARAKTIPSGRSEEPIPFNEGHTQPIQGRQAGTTKETSRERGNEDSRSKESKRVSQGIETGTQGFKRNELQEDRGTIKDIRTTTVEIPSEPFGDNENDKVSDFRSGENRQIDLKGQSEAIHNTNGNNSWNDINDNRNLSSSNLLDQIVESFAEPLKKAEEQEKEKKLLAELKEKEKSEIQYKPRPRAKEHDRDI